MYADDFFTILPPYLVDGLRQGLRQFEENTRIQLYSADKEFFIGRVDLMSAIIDTFNPEAYGPSRAEGSTRLILRRTGLRQVNKVSKNER